MQETDTLKGKKLEVANFKNDNEAFKGFLTHEGNLLAECPSAFTQGSARGMASMAAIMAN